MSKFLQPLLFIIGLVIPLMFFSYAGGDALSAYKKNILYPWPHLVITLSILTVLGVMVTFLYKNVKWVRKLFGPLVVTPIINIFANTVIGVSLLTFIPKIYQWINRIIINTTTSRVRSRPHPYSTAHHFVSWKGLSDKTWSSRHLPADPEFNKQFEAGSENKNREQVKALASDLFTRDTAKDCEKSTLLFPTFAQYLTDGFIRTETVDTGLTETEKKKILLRNTSNHDIDLCTLYGRTEDHGQVLREYSNDVGRRGRLKTQLINGEEYSPFLFQHSPNKKDEELNLPDETIRKSGDTINVNRKKIKLKQILIDHKIEFREGFERLDPPLGLPARIGLLLHKEPIIAQQARESLLSLFAVGGDRVNSVPQTSMLNTLFLLEHNRLAKEISSRHTDWDDDRVYETSRNVVIIQFIKIVVNDYINHIVPTKLKLEADPKAAWRAEWNKPNWISVEFSLLYRWHGLIPDNIRWGDRTYPVHHTFMDNRPFIGGGIIQGFNDMAAQNAGKISALNTTPELIRVEEASIKHGRACELASYNAYREYCGQDRISPEDPKGFEKITKNKKTQKMLEKHYKTVDNVEFFTGIFCEDSLKNSPLPPTIGTLVAVDAFSQALTNPLLSKHIFKKPKYKNGKLKPGEVDAFTPYGFEEFEKLQTLEDLVKRNVSDTSKVNKLSMTRADWKPVPWYKSE